MSKNEVFLKLDKLGGLSDAEDLILLNLPQSEKEAITKYFEKKVLPLKYHPKIVSIIYILAVFIVFIFIIDLIIITTRSNDVILGILIACPLLLVLLGIIGGNQEKIWTTAIKKLEINLNRITSHKCFLEHAYVPRYGGDMPKSFNVCSLRHSHFVLIIVDSTHYKVVSKEIMNLSDSKYGCMLSPYHKTNLSRYLLKKKKKEVTSAMNSAYRSKVKLKEYETDKIIIKENSKPPTMTDLNKNLNLESGRTIENSIKSERNVLELSQKMPNIFRTDYTSEEVPQIQNHTIKVVPDRKQFKISEEENLSLDERDDKNQSNDYRL
jgi:hypothetical protein